MVLSLGVLKPWYHSMVTESSRKTFFQVWLLKVSLSSSRYHFWLPTLVAKTKSLVLRPVDYSRFRSYLTTLVTNRGIFSLLLNPFLNTSCLTPYLMLVIYSGTNTGTDPAH